jgi:hypothetical protein
VVFNSCAIHVSPRPSSTHCRILDACGFSATLLFPKAPFSFTLCCFLGHMYHFLLPDARCICTLLTQEHPWSARGLIEHQEHEEVVGEPRVRTEQGRRDVGEEQ